MKLQPIATAPRDGTWFIGLNEWYPESLTPMRRHRELDRWVVPDPDAPEGMVKTIRDDYPTHWTPLATPTTEGQ